MLTAKNIISMLKLKPLQVEGGYFIETYRSKEHVKSPHKRYKGKRCFSTAIYYLLTPLEKSKIHRIKSDEVFHFYLGDPVEMFTLTDTGKGKTVLLGNNLEKGQRPQITVPKGVWQGARLKKGGRFALLGTTVAPGFEYKDFETGSRDVLIKKYPKFAAVIKSLA